MPKIKNKFKLPKTKYLLLLMLLVLGITPMLFVASYVYAYSDKIYPNVYVANTQVGGLTSQQATESLKNTQVEKLILAYDKNEKFEIATSEIGLKYDLKSTINNAYTINRDSHPVENIVNGIKSLWAERRIQFEYSYDESKLNEYILLIAEEKEIVPVYPNVSFSDDEIVVENGSKGVEIDKTKLLSDINALLAQAKTSEVEIITSTIDPTINSVEALALEERARKLIGKSLQLEIEDKKYTFDDSDIISLLSSKNTYSDSAISELINTLSPEVERQAQNPVFEFSDGRVKEFKPAKDGLTINTGLLTSEITTSLNILEVSNQTSANIAIPVARTEPNIKTEEVNNLGIKELLGTGTSTFRGSIPGRVHNVGHAAGKFNGVLVKPGDIVSFNEITGDISVLTGYKQAYIIQDGKTILGDGGGVCQVSTTLFRAILSAGLPIVERRAHSYRVAYYEQGSPPGLDATVYYPTTDLKFKNDTPAHLLIQTYFDAKNYSLKFEIYGTSDGRVATISEPVISSQTPPPEPYYQDDPSLPLGQVKQIDWAAWGAKVSFNYKVERNGEIIYEKLFASNYKAWQAKYLRGTAQ